MCCLCAFLCMWHHESWPAVWSSNPLNHRLLVHGKDKERCWFPEGNQDPFCKAEVTEHRSAPFWAAGAGLSWKTNLLMILPCFLHLRSVVVRHWDEVKVGSCEERRPSICSTVLPLLYHGQQKIELCEMPALVLWLFKTIICRCSFFFFFF